jgi:hypothetical protein
MPSLNSRRHTISRHRLVKITFHHQRIFVVPTGNATSGVIIALVNKARHHRDMCRDGTSRLDFILQCKIR